MRQRYNIKDFLSLYYIPPSELLVKINTGSRFYRVGKGEDSHFQIREVKKKALVVQVQKKKSEEMLLAKAMLAHVVFFGFLKASILSQGPEIT